MKDVCYICGEEGERTNIGVSLCDKQECVDKWIDETYCPICQKGLNRFVKGGMGLGKVTQWTFYCPDHKDVKFTRYTYLNETKKCPRCKKEVCGEISIAVLESIGECPKCDHLREDARDIEAEMRASKERED